MLFFEDALDEALDEAFDDDLEEDSFDESFFLSSFLSESDSFFSSFDSALLSESSPAVLLSTSKTEETVPSLPAAEEAPPSIFLSQPVKAAAEMIIAAEIKIVIILLLIIKLLFSTVFLCDIINTDIGCVKTDGVYRVLIIL